MQGDSMILKETYKDMARWEILIIIIIIITQNKRPTSQM